MSKLIMLKEKYIMYFLFIYECRTKKYKTVISNQITNFVFESFGRQTHEFCSKPFHYVDRTTNTTEMCQILIVTESVDQITALKKKRITVPKLNNSDLEIPVSQKINSSNMLQAKQKRKENQQKRKKAITETNADIIKVHICQHQTSSTFSAAMNAPNNESNLNKLDDVEQNYSDHVGLRCETPINEVSSDESENTTLVQNTNCKNQFHYTQREQNNNDSPQKALQEIEMLKETVEKERNLRIKATGVANVLKDKYFEFRQKCSDGNQQHQNENTNESSLSNEVKNDTVTFPINKLQLNSGIPVKKSSIDFAYDQMKPNKFYSSVLTSVYGYKELSNRCVKRNRKKPAHTKPLTPSKVNTVKYHFRHFLKEWKYPSIILSYYVRQINSLSNRAITSAKKHERLKQTFNVSSDPEDEEETVRQWTLFY